MAQDARAHRLLGFVCSHRLPPVRRALGLGWFAAIARPDSHGWKRARNPHRPGSLERLATGLPHHRPPNRAAPSRASCAAADGHRTETRSQNRPVELPPATRRGRSAGRESAASMDRYRLGRPVVRHAPWPDCRAHPAGVRTRTVAHEVGRLREARKYCFAQRVSDARRRDGGTRQRSGGARTIQRNGSDGGHARHHLGKCFDELSYETYSARAQSGGPGLRREHCGGRFRPDLSRRVRRRAIARLHGERVRVSGAATLGCAHRLSGLHRRSRKTNRGDTSRQRGGRFKTRLHVTVEQAGDRRAFRRQGQNHRAADGGDEPAARASEGLRADDQRNV